MRTVFYLLTGIIAFATCCAVYGLGVATARLIRCRFLAGECCMPNWPKYEQLPRGQGDFVDKFCTPTGRVS
jgi:hypothetical protein